MSLTLKLNGTLVDLSAARCELGSLVRSLAAPDSLTLRRAIAFDEPTDWDCMDQVTLLQDGVALFDGWVASADRLASAEGEHILYTCLGLRDAADTVPFRRSIGGAVTARVVYNCPCEEELEEHPHIAIPGPRSTVGEILADLLDAAAPQLAGTIGDGTPGSGYVPADLAALAVVPGKVVLHALSVDAAILEVLRAAPDFGYWIDPATHQARFFDFRSLAAKEVAGVAGSVLRQQLDFTTAGCYSACTVEGDHEQVDILEQLTPAWDAGLEASWTSELAAQQPDTYGKVWRLFAASEPAAAGGAIAPQRFVGHGAIAAVISIEEGGVTTASAASASVVDGTKLLLDTLARQWNAITQSYEPATVHARFAYRTARVSGRYPAAGHTGTAHARRGLARELSLLAEDRTRKTVKGTVEAVLSSTQFRTRYELALPGELAGLAIQFNADGVDHPLADNDAATLTLAEAPANPIEAGDSFVITVQDDTLKLFEGGTLSVLEKYAKETLERVMDERIVGAVPLTGLDWTLALGQKVSFTGTNDPEYATLGATLVAVEHDLAHERTILALTTHRAGGVAWDDLERQRARDRQLDELERQIRRLWKRLRARRVGGGAHGDPHVGEAAGPYVGDGTWIGVVNKVIGHIGPGPAELTVGGQGQYIQWISLDARKHVVDAGAGTFS